MVLRTTVGLTLGGAAVVAALTGAAYLDAPPPGHTGGFGEPSCHECHFDRALDEPGGAITLEGWPDRYDPGATYTVAVTLARAGVAAAGFQLAARIADGAERGRQAGFFTAIDARTMVQVDGERGIDYVSHSEAGTRPTSTDRAEWQVRWTAPDPAIAPVVVHVAANAANDDASEFGDSIYLTERLIRPARP